MLHHTDDVGGVASSCAFGVVRMDGPVLDSLYGRLDEARLVECVGVDQSLDVVLVADGETGIDCRRSATPVFVQF